MGTWKGQLSSFCWKFLTYYLSGTTDNNSDSFWFSFIILNPDLLLVVHKIFFLSHSCVPEHRKSKQQQKHFPFCRVGRMWSDSVHFKPSWQTQQSHKQVCSNSIMHVTCLSKLSYELLKTTWLSTEGLVLPTLILKHYTEEGKRINWVLNCPNLS